MASSFSDASSSSHIFVHVCAIMSAAFSAIHHDRCDGITVWHDRKHGCVRDSNGSIYHVLVALDATTAVGSSYAPSLHVPD